MLFQTYQFTALNFIESTKWKIFILLFLFILSPVIGFGIENIDSLKSKLGNATDEKTKVNIILDISDYFLDTNLDSARDYADNVILIAEKNNYQIEIARANQYKGIAEAIDNHAEKANLFFQKSLEIYNALDDKAGLSKTYNNMGIVFNMNQNFPEAIANYKKALNYYEEDKDSIKMAPILMNIGVLYFDIEKYDLSLKYCQNAYNIYNNHNDKTGRAECANNIGDVFKQIGKLDSALIFYDKSLQLEIENKRNYGIGFELNSLGETEFLRGNYKTALDYFFQALKYRTEINTQFEICETNINIGKTYYSTGNLNQAEKYCLKGIVVAEEIKNESAIRDGALVLSNIYEKQKKFDKSLYYYQKFSSVKDSIIIKKNHKKITQISMEYEFNKKLIANDLEFKAKLEKQVMFRNYLLLFSCLGIILTIVVYSRFRLKRSANIALTERNTIITEQKQSLSKTAEELTEAINTKNKFFSIIAHDIKNPYNIVIGFAELLKNEYDSFDDNQRKEFISEIYKASNLTYELLENLLVWANGQRGEIIIKKENILVSDIVKNSLSAYLQAAEKKQISITYQIPADLFVYADKTTLTIVIGNLFNNAVKFTRQNGIINIMAIQNPESINISITDNGVGIDSLKLKNLFRLDKSQSTLGTENEKGTGLGLILCKDFVEKNNGILEVKSSLEKGSTFIVSLPKFENS